MRLSCDPLFEAEGTYTAIVRAAYDLDLDEGYLDGSIDLDLRSDCNALSTSETSLYARGSEADTITRFTFWQFFGMILVVIVVFLLGVCVAYVLMGVNRTEESKQVHQREVQMSDKSSPNRQLDTTPDNTMHTEMPLADDPQL